MITVSLYAVYMRQCKCHITISCLKFKLLKKDWHAELLIVRHIITNWTKALKNFPDPTDAHNTNNNRRRRQLFGRLKSASTSRLLQNNNNNSSGRAETCSNQGDDSSCSPVENLRRQLQKLEDLEDQFPASTHTDTYLRYPFTTDSG